MHHYDFENLKEYVTRKLRVTLLDEIVDDGVCLLLGERQR